MSEQVKAVVFGDSQSTGYLLSGTDVPWPNIVATAIDDTVINRAINGLPTAGLLSRLDDEFDLYDPEIIMVMIGVNDFPYIPRNDVGSIAMFKWRIRDIIRKCVERAPTAKIIIGTVIHNKSTGDWPEVYDFQGDLPLITHQMSAELNADIRYAKVADKMLDVYYDESPAAWAALWADPTQPVVHPSYAGHQKIAEAFLEALQ